jgi:hypothetical protein
MRINKLSYGEPFKIFIGVKPNSKLDNLSFSIRIDSFSGEPVTHCASEDEGYLFSANPDKILGVTATIKGLVLNPGEYTIKLAVRGFDEVLHALRFDILNATYEGTRPYSGMFGYVYAKTDWEIVTK